MRNYISLGSGFPRIGYCVYEISYQEDRSHGLSVETGFNNLSADEGEVRSVSFTFMSNFVQMRPDVSLSDYLSRFCRGIFETEIKAFAEMNFAQLYLEFRAHRLSQCQPTQGPLNPAGDPQCQAWAERSLHPAIRRRTVARCEQQADLSFQCVAKAREGGLCPAWRSREPDSLGQFRISELRQHRSDIRLSFGYQEFPCDEGLRCEQDSFSFSGLFGWPTFTCRH
jgi:hypothetical protein